ncbi:FGGY-family carbohydrate kinase [Brevibacillus sp. B_LB10_24]|uniref:xylulokinase n=1 Tax=Brevibacillus sp. B_LB10_24 TaxID=3380645 RepID=UPI0038BAA03F
MKYIASFDIGTTSAKGILVSEHATIHEETTISLRTEYGQEGEVQTIEQDPDQWYEAVVAIAQSWWASGINPADVQLIAMSGQMQDCIPIDGMGNPVRPAILYTDVRAGQQAGRIAAELGEDKIRQVTGNHMDGSLTFPKILWLMEQERAGYEKTASFLISSKDYVIRKLTGRNVADPTTGATSGAMDLSTRQWSEVWFHQFGLDSGKMPELLSTDSIAGHVLPEAAAATGFAVHTPVLCGIGDAGATTIGAGVTEPGDVYAYLGTSGWVAATTDQVGFIGGGGFHLAHVASGLLIAITPLSNAGSAHKWALSVFGGRGAEGEADEAAAFTELEQEMAACDRSHSSAVFLPYLNGERCPVNDPLANGCFIGLTSRTTRAEMSCAVLEGVAMAMRQVMELLSVSNRSNRLVLIGGGTKSRVWNQIFADITGMEVIVPQEAQFLPALGCAAAGFIRLGWSESYEQFARTRLASQPFDRYVPDKGLSQMYQKKYERYLMLYPALQDVFHR